MITSHYGAPLMVARKQGLIIEVTDGVDYKYRGSLFYSLAKVSAIHLTEAMAADLQPHGVTALASDPKIAEKSGQTFSTWGLVGEYGFTDADGRQPHWGNYFAEHVAKRK